MGMELSCKEDLNITLRMKNVSAIVRRTFLRTLTLFYCKGTCLFSSLQTLRPVTQDDATNLAPNALLLQYHRRLLVLLIGASTPHLCCPFPQD